MIWKATQVMLCKDILNRPRLSTVQDLEGNLEGDLRHAVLGYPKHAKAVQDRSCTCVLIALLLLVDWPMLASYWSRIFAPREAATQVGRQVADGREGRIALHLLWTRKQFTFTSTGS